MPGKILFMLFVLFVTCILAGNSDAQTARKAVGAAETNGTFRDYFTGKLRGNYNEIRILSIGKNKLRVAFNLTYPYVDATGEMTANVGEADGEATIVGDTATFSPEETNDCTITVKFVKPGTSRVKQNGGSECGFGFNVSASGTYRKTSAAKPRFD